MLLTDPGAGSALSYAQQRNVASEVLSPSTQSAPSKPVLWAAWRDAPVQSSSASTVTTAAVATASVNSGSPSIPTRVSLENMAPLYLVAAQPAPTSHTAIAGAAEGPVAARLQAANEGKSGSGAGPSKTRPSTSEALSLAQERIRTLETQVKRLEMCFDSDNVPPAVLQTPVAAHSEVVAQLRQARDRISELESYQQTGQARETELGQENSALRVQLQARETTQRACEAALQQVEAHIAELRSAQQVWQQREAELVRVNADNCAQAEAARLRMIESHREIMSKTTAREPPSSQDRGMAANRVQQILVELQAAKQKLSQEQITYANEAMLAAQARDAAVSSLHSRERELQQAKLRVTELENAQSLGDARELTLTEEKETLAKYLQKSLAELRTAKDDVTRLQGKVDVANASRDAAGAAAAAPLATPDGLTEMKGVDELQRQVQQMAHDYELQRQALDLQRELASAAQQGLRGAKRRLQDSEKAHQERVRELQREAETLREQLHSRRNVALTLTTDLATVRGELATARAEANGLEGAHAQLSAAQAEVGSLRGLLNVERQRVVNMEAQRAASDARWKKRNAELVSEKATLQQRLDRLTAEMQRPAVSGVQGAGLAASNALSATQQGAAAGAHSPARGTIPQQSMPLSPQPGAQATAADAQSEVQALRRDREFKNQTILDLQRQLCELQERFASK
jgi:DNA repair exonuclease SbcCD ATPase subunit